MSSGVNLVWNLGRSWIRVKKIDFSRQIFENFDFFSGPFTQKVWFFRQKLVIYSYFWANYSISLQKSPLSNILPVHDKLQ